jgi:hypothetical protein
MSSIEERKTPSTFIVTFSGLTQPQGSNLYHDYTLLRQQVIREVLRFQQNGRLNPEKDMVVAPFFEVEFDTLGEAEEVLRHF